MEHFKVHVLNDQGIEKAKDIQKAFEEFEERLSAIWGNTDKETFLTVGRTYSLCMTKLEEASFYAKKTMAQKPVNQKK